jgi:Cys-rich repeat protein
MKKAYLLGLAAAALFAGIYVQGCSGDTGTDGGTSTACTSDAQCGTGQVCDTANGQCLTTCTQGSECPDTEKTCAPLAGVTGNVCQCSTDQLCGAGFVCNTTDKICQQTCTSDSQCQGYATARTCDTATGQCVASSVVTDGGPTACSATNPCAAGSYCDTTGACVAGADNCTTPDTQDNCAYGQACFVDASYSAQPLCEEPFGTGGQCPNVSNPPAITPNASPVIFNVRRTGTTDSTDSNCVDGSGNQLTVVEFAADYYDPQNDVSTSSQLYSHIKYVTPSGTQQATYSTTSNDGSSYTFRICSPTASIHAGVVIIDTAGNISNTGCIPF